MTKINSKVLPPELSIGLGTLMEHKRLGYIVVVTSITNSQEFDGIVLHAVDLTCTHMRHLNSCSIDQFQVFNGELILKNIL